MLLLHVIFATVTLCLCCQQFEQVVYGLTNLYLVLLVSVYNCGNNEALRCNVMIKLVRKRKFQHSLEWAVLVNFRTLLEGIKLKKKGVCVSLCLGSIEQV